MSLLCLTSSHSKSQTPGRIPEHQCLCFSPSLYASYYPSCSFCSVTLVSMFLKPVRHTPASSLWSRSSLCLNGFFPRHAWLTTSSLSGLVSYAPSSVKPSLRHTVRFPLSFPVLSLCLATSQ